MIRNFVFHRLAAQVQNPTLEMDVRLFEKCVQFINNKYQVICIEDTLHEEELKKSKRPFACLTFDDGYKDNLEYAAPILDKYNCKASFYVVTNCVEKNIPLWGHLLEYLFLHTRVSAIDLTDDNLPANLRLTRLPSDPVQRMGYFKKLKTCLTKMPVSKKDKLFNNICCQLDDVEAPPMMMNWKDLSSLKKAGHYIGSHTHTHNALTLVESDALIKKELSLPRQLIQKNLGYLPLSIAYPFGFCNEKIKRMSAEAGYQLGIAADIHQLYVKHIHDNFEIPRIALCNESWFKTKLRITNRIEQIKSIVPDSFIYRKARSKQER